MKLHTRYRRQLGMLAICGWMVLGSSVAATGAEASPGKSGAVQGGPVDAWVAEKGPLFWQHQRAMVDLKTWILSQPGIKSSGYIDEIHDPAANSVVLLWRGSSSLQAAAIAEAARLGIESVAVSQKPYTLEQLQAASSALLDSRDAFAKVGFGITAVDGVPGDELPAVEGIPVPGFDGRVVEALASRIAGFQVRVIQVDSAPRLFLGRQIDTSPFYAGGLAKNGIGAACSSGFAFNYGGSPRITTARHCNFNESTGQVDNSAFRTGASANNNWGTPVYKSNYGAVNILGGAGAGYAYDGSYNDPNGYNKAVFGTFTPSVGDALCAGGANSGEHCSLYVKDTNQTFYDYSGGNLATVKAERSSGIAAASGDSGGPIIQPIGSGGGSGKVYAVGFIQGAVNDVTTNCPPVAYAPGTIHCSRSVNFTNVTTVLNHAPVSLVTN